MSLGNALRRDAVNSTPLSPSAILGASLVAHYKADAGTSSTTDGASLSAWNDQAGTNHLAQATSAKQPTYRAAVRNGLPVVRFDGAAQFMQKAFTLAQPAEILIAAVFRSTVAATSTAFSGGTSSSGAIFFNSGHLLSAFAGASLGYGTTHGIPTETNWTMYDVLFSGASSQISFNGSSFVVVGNAGTNALGGVTLGASAASSGSQFAAVDIGEVIVSTAAMTALQRSQLHGYLNQRWGTT